MLLKPDKLPSLTTSYRLIGLISSIMKLFERVIEQRLRYHLEKIEFLHKHQSGFRRAKSTDDHLFRRFSSWPCDTSQRKWFVVQPNEPQSRGSTGFCPESITFSNLRQRPTNTAPQRKLSQFADDTAQWALSLNVCLQQNFLQQDLLN